MIRTEAQLTVSRFCELIGMSRRAYYARRERHLLGPRPKGPWPTPALDAIQAEVLRIVDATPSMSHRQVWAALRDAGLGAVSVSSVQRVMVRRSLDGDPARITHSKEDSSSRR